MDLNSFLQDLVVTLEFKLFNIDLMSEQFIIKTPIYTKCAGGAFVKQC